MEIHESLMEIRVEEKKLEIFFSKMFAELKKVVLLPRNSQSGNSSVGRARPCQGRGREFESRFPLHKVPMEVGIFCVSA